LFGEDLEFNLLILKVDQPRLEPGISRLWEAGETGSWKNSTKVWT